MEWSHFLVFGNTFSKDIDFLSKAFGGVFELHLLRSAWKLEMHTKKHVGKAKKKEVGGCFLDGL
jgi:hypothetical protein